VATLVKYILLCYTPIILSTLSYALLYYQLIDLNTRSRLAVGVAARARFGNQRLQKCISWTLFVYIGFFIAIEIMLMILVLFGLVKNVGFLIQLIVLIGVLVVTLNIWATILYCSNSGSPYKNEKIAKKAARYNWAAAVWTTATVAKLVLGWFDPIIFNVES